MSRWYNAKHFSFFLSCIHTSLFCDNHNTFTFLRPITTRELFMFFLNTKGNDWLTNLVI